MVIAILAANFFSSKVLLVKLALQDGASPLQILSIRMATALPFFAITCLLVLRAMKARPRWRDFAGMTALGFIGYYLSSLLDFHGMAYISAGMERLILYLYPTFIVIIRGIMERKAPTRLEILSLILAYIGTGFVYHDEHRIAGSHALRGGLMVLGSAFCFANYLYFSGNYIRKFGSRLFASYSSSVSCAAIVVHALIVGAGEGRELSQGIIGIGLALGIFCTVLPTFAMHQAISMIGSSRVGILGTTGIIFPLFLGVALFAEPLTLFRILGTIFVLLAVLCLRKES